MTYSSKISKSQEKAYKHAIATKIRDLMANLRKSSNENRKRRWIWELLQNAKDASYEDQRISVRILFEENGNNGRLEFKHNGQPFSVDNITFLIEQVSTKDQKITSGETPKNTGKFGTGFLTTHLLSEVVNVEGIIKENDLPYIDFKFLLDRSKREVEEIIESVNNSLAVLNNLDSRPPIEFFVKDKLNTSFSYELNSKSVEVGAIGLKDLKACIPFVLVFLPKFESVEIASEGIIYKLLPNVENIANNIFLYKVIKSDLFDPIEHNILVVTNGNTSIAIEVEIKLDVILFKDFTSSIPKIFCDFPLVGTEDFPFPLIINNSAFSPTEPRDGIDLSDNEDIDIENNKKYILEAIELYEILLVHASKNNWQNLYVLAKIKNAKEKDWLSKKWFDTKVLEPIRKLILYTPIVDTLKNERVPILDFLDEPNVWFPFSVSKETRDAIFNLYQLWHPEQLPSLEHIDNWYEVYWNDCGKLDLKELTVQIQNCESIGKLETELKNIPDTMTWLNEYYELLTSEGNIVNEINNDVYWVIPNQNGEFKSRSHIFLDKGIGEELKNVLLILGIDVRDELLDRRCQTGPNIKYFEKKSEMIIASINDELRNDNNENKDKACNHLISLFPSTNVPKGRQQLYDFCCTAFNKLIPEKKYIETYDETIWLEADKYEVKWIVDSISSSKSLESLMVKYQFRDLHSTLRWLNDFVQYLTEFGYESKLNLKTAPILPNQNGEFIIKDSIFLDSGDIDEDLKDIVKDLGSDFRQKLLSKEIYLELSDNRTLYSKDITDEILELIIPKFSEVKRSQETKDIFRKLFLWMKINDDKARILFGDLFLNKHKLYDDDEIASSMTKAEQYSSLMQEYKIADIHELRQVLEQRTVIPSHVNLPPITQEALASLGITSKEELELAFEDKDFASLYSHTSVTNAQMFLYSQKLIARAKQNVINHLSTLDGYDCSETEEIAPTVIGGIKKNDIEIYIVIRPSDNGIVIIYYNSEKDILEEDGAELWIDNGLSIPMHLTLGRVIKRIGINKIIL